MTNAYDRLVAEAAEQRLLEHMKDMGRRAGAAALAATALRWQTKPPTAPGEYWIRRSGQAPVTAAVRLVKGVAQTWINGNGGPLLPAQVTHWYGPLEPPAEGPR